MIKALNDENFDGLVDPRLENEFDISEMTKMVACAAASVRHSAKRRPKMSQVTIKLKTFGNISPRTRIKTETCGHCSLDTCR